MSRRNRPVWGPALVPSARRDLVRSLAAESARIAAIRVPDHLINAAELRENSAGAVADLDRIRAAAIAADLFWVAAPMGRAALDASQDVPGLRREDVPAPAGLMVFEESLPAWDTSEIGGLALRRGTDVEEFTAPVPVDAILWTVHGSTIDIDLLTRPRNLPLPLHGVESAHLTSFVHARAPLPVRFGEGMPALGPEGVTLGGAWEGPAALLAAAWVMMMNPTVAERRTLDPTRPRKAGSTGSSSAPAREVTVIDLRPLRHVTDEEPESTGRKLTTRHLVRGYWSNRPYGPNNELRRLEWIASYVRGPEGAPWRTATETVYAWRR